MNKVVKCVIAIIIGVVGVIVIAAVGQGVGGAAPLGRASVNLAKVDLAKAHELLNRSYEEGYITFFACSDHEAEVTPQFWTGLGTSGQKGLTISLAAICHQQQYGEHITILDNQSREPLALFSGGIYRTGGIDRSE